MKKLCTLLAVLTIVLTAIGFYRGWLAVSSSRHGDSNKINVNLTVDPDKVKEDAETAKEKTSHLAARVIKDAKEPGDADSEGVKW